MALDACLFCACMKCTRDGKNNDDEIMGKMARRNQVTYRVQVQQDINSGSLQRFMMVEGSTMVFTIFMLPSRCMCVWKEWKKDSPNSQNPHIYLHVPEMIHGAHEACSSPFGIHFYSPKELRIIHILLA
jgi:hypothetical protein